MTDITDIPYERLIRIGRQTEGHDAPEHREEDAAPESYSPAELSKRIERDARRYTKTLGR